MLDSDTGIGLSATDVDQLRLFVPFQQADVCNIPKLLTSFTDVTRVPLLAVSEEQDLAFPYHVNWLN